MEKRVAPRKTKRLTVRYGVEKPEITGFTTNLSVTGIRLKTNKVIAPGQTIQLEIKFPSRSILLWGRVAWAKKVPPQLAHVLDPGMGIAFVDPPADWETFFEEWAAG